MLWRSAIVVGLLSLPVTAEAACPTAVIRLVTESIEIFRDRDFQQSAGRLDRDHVPPGTPITACWASIAYRIEINGETFWVRRMGVRTQAAATGAPQPSDKIMPYGAGGRGMFE